MLSNIFNNINSNNRHVQEILDNQKRHCNGVVRAIFNEVKSQFHPTLTFRSVPFAAFNSRPSMPGTLQCSKSHTLVGPCFSQLCEIIDTWAPVSQRASVSSPLSKHFTVHLRPTRRTSYVCSSGDKWLTKTTVFSLSSVYFGSSKGSDVMKWTRVSTFLRSTPLTIH